GYALVQIALVDRGDVDAVPRHRARVGEVEPGDELGESRLPRSVLADERDHLAAAQGAADAVDRPLFLPRVAERDTGEGDLGRAAVQPPRGRRAAPARDVVEAGPVEVEVEARLVEVVDLVDRVGDGLPGRAHGQRGCTGER